MLWEGVGARLLSATRWLAQGESSALLLATTESPWRAAALETIALGEHEDDTLRAFVWLEASWSGDGGWRERAAALEQESVRVRAALEEGGLRCGALEEEIAPSTCGAPLGKADVLGFAHGLRVLCRALPAELDGLVVVLAPARPDSMDGAWVETFGALVREPSLARVRWVVVSVCAQPALDVLVGSLASRAYVLRAVPRPEALQATGRDVLRGMVDGRSGAGPKSATVPACGEWEEPSADRFQRAASVVQDPGALRLPSSFDSEGGRGDRAGGDPLLEDPEWFLQPAPSSPPRAPLRGAPSRETGGASLFDQVRALVASSALALSERRGLDAVRHLRDARDLCFAHGRTEDGIRLELMLASTLVGLGKLAEAEEVASWAATHALEAQVAPLATQACLVLGMVRSARGADAGAIEAFRDGGETAERAGLAPLALEAWRMAGDAAARVGHEPAATEAWKHALRLAGDEPEGAVGLQAGALAERLAEVCARHGLHEHAASFRAQAEKLGAGVRGAVASQAIADVRPAGPASSVVAEALSTPGPSTAAFREGSIADVPRNKVAPELKGTVRLDEDPLADRLPDDDEAKG